MSFAARRVTFSRPQSKGRRRKILVETEPIWGRGEENATAVVVVSGALIGVVKPPNDAETTQGRRRPMRVQCPPRFSQWSASVSLHTDVGGNLSEGVSCGYGDLDIASSSFLSLQSSHADPKRSQVVKKEGGRKGGYFFLSPLDPPRFYLARSFQMRYLLCKTGVH